MSTIVQPVCMCGTLMRCERNGIIVEHDEAEFQVSGDLWHCPHCGHEVVSGFARDPIVSAYESERWAVRKPADVHIVGQ